MTLQQLYDATRQGAWAFPGFAAASLLLLVATAVRGRFARRAGLLLLGLSTAMLVAGFAIRWKLSGNAWYLPPMLNQFEAVYASAMLAAVLALVLDVLARQSIFAMAASVYATVAMLACLMFGPRIGANISQAAGILNSPVMALHVSTIIIGHALVGMTFIISLVYLVALLVTRRAQSAGADLADDMRDAVSSLGHGGDSPAAASGQPVPLLERIDRCNLIIVQLATLLVIVGTVLGAYWGDFAWGRWWGWDNKETWALITCVVYVMILHVRLVTSNRRRGLVTALLCVIGGTVMVFNWVAVNYLFHGMHSYAG